MTKSCNSIPESFVSIMGDPPIIHGEDNATYMLLLKKLGAATAAYNIIDWMMVKDVADLTWQIIRMRRWISAILDNGRREGLVAGIDQLINPRPGSLVDQRAVQYAMEHYLDKKEDANGRDGAARLDTLLDGFQLDADNLAAANSFSRNFDIFEKAEELLNRLEDRRDRTLQRIEKRKSWGAALRSASDSAIAEPASGISTSNVEAAAPSLVPGENAASPDVVKPTTASGRAVGHATR
jgi:hypothetical protein